MVDKQTSLEWLEELNFEGTCSLQQVWTGKDLPSIELHDKPLHALMGVVKRLEENPGAKPLGQVVVGPVGSGKTHLLHRLRLETEQHGPFFVLCDLIDTSDFWENVLGAFITSLIQSSDETEKQVETLVDLLIWQTPVGEKHPNVRKALNNPKNFKNNLDVCVKSVRDTLNCPDVIHGDIVRALFLLVNQEADKRDIGLLWLKGIDHANIQKEYEQYGFRLTPIEAHGAGLIDRIRALSWVMHLASTTVVCFDQFDAFFLQASVLQQHAEQRAAHQTPSSATPNIRLRKEANAKTSHESELALQFKEEQRQAEKVLMDVTAGFMGLWDILSRSVMVLTCMESSWDLIKTQSVQSVKGRFAPPIKLEGLSKPQIESLITKRMEKSVAAFHATYQQEKPYKTFPFTQEKIDQWVGLNARVILTECAEHIQHCRLNQKLVELKSTPPINTPVDSTSTTEVAAVLERYQTLKNAVDVESLRQHAQDKNTPFCQWLFQLFVALIRQYTQLPHDSIGQLKLKDGFDSKTNSTNGLDAQVLITPPHTEASEPPSFSLSFAFSFLPCHHAMSFISKLKPALEHSSIRENFGQNHLQCLFLGEMPSGSVSKTLIQAAHNYGANFTAITDSDLTEVWVIAQLASEKSPGFDAWLRAEYPVNRLEFIKNSGILTHLPSPPLASTHQPVESTAASVETDDESLILDKTLDTSEPHLDQTDAQHLDPHDRDSEGDPNTHQDQDDKQRVETKQVVKKGVKKSATKSVEPENTQEAPSLSTTDEVINKETDPASTDETVDDQDASSLSSLDKRRIPLGTQNRRGQTDTLTLNPFDLRKHGVVLAGAGSGKTVLVKRIIEECAARGIPSIVIDGANDMTRLGQAWPEIPESFTAQDKETMSSYFNDTETFVWTPGLSGGNPLFFDVMPDLQHLNDEPDEMNQALSLVHQSLVEIAVSGSSQSAKSKSAVLMEALRDFYAFETGSLPQFIEYLNDLPPEIGSGFAQAAKYAKEIGEALLAEMTINPMLNKGLNKGLKTEAASINPSALFGQHRQKTRVSVINLMGLQGSKTQQQFVNQFAMGLFTWMKKNPAPNGTLGGLIVIDEAKDFVPSQGKSLSKAALVRLTAQARKYGFGIIFATQSPKSIDHNVIANATTQWYGKAGSTTAIETIKKQLIEHGGTGQGVGKLKTGEFYVFSEGFKQPERIKTSLCLSHHPDSPPSEKAVMQLAKESRLKLEAEANTNDDGNDKTEEV